MLNKMIGAWGIFAQANSGQGPSDSSGSLSHGDIVGWAGTILSIATAFTGGFVMMYQRIQRARRDDTMEWMKLRQGSLQFLLEQANRERGEIREEVDTLTAKLATVTKQNGEQLEQIVELTRHIASLGILIGRLPSRLRLGSPPSSPADPAGIPVDSLDQTVVCLESVLNQLRLTTEVLGKIADINRPAETTDDLPPDEQLKAPAPAECHPEPEKET